MSLSPDFFANTDWSKMTGVTPGTDPVSVNIGNSLAGQPATYSDPINGVLANPAPAATTTSTSPNLQDDYYKKLFEEQKRQQRETASVFLQNILRTYGLDSLAGQVDSLIQQWGTNIDLIALKLKDTEPYKQRFAGLISLQARGIRDIRNESEYLALETSYRQVFREAGLSDFLGESGTQPEFAKIADIVGKYSLSVNEVRDRISDAQRAAVNTPDEVKTALRDFYGIDTTQLVAWSLDPVATMAEINRKVNAGMAAGYASQAGLGIGVGTSEMIADMYGKNDLTVGQLTQDVQRSKEVNDSTQRLAFIDKENLTADEAVQSTLGLSADAQKKVNTLQSRERARFSGSSAVRTGSLSRTI